MKNSKIMQSSPAGIAEAGNTIYRVYVIDIGSSLGQYTVTTGPGHPAGPGLNVLYGNGSPWTTFNTIRSYTSGTDYVQKLALSVNPVVILGPFGTLTPIGETGFRATYSLPGPGIGASSTPDALTIISDVKVNGTTFANSTTEVTTTVINNDSKAVEIGIRYEWDFQIGADDGPTFQEVNLNGPVRTQETEFINPGFEIYRIVDNDDNPSPPTFYIYGTVTGPASITPQPTPPDLLQFVNWDSAYDQAFEYSVDPTLVTTGNDSNDSAVLYFFGQNRANAITIPAGGQYTVSASLLLTLPGPLPWQALEQTQIVSDGRTGYFSITTIQLQNSKYQIIGSSVS